MLANVAEMKSNISDISNNCMLYECFVAECYKPAVYVCAAAHLEESRFIPGRHRRHSSQSDIDVVTVTDRSILTTSAADGL